MAENRAIKVNEIFYSIQGESSWAGFPTVFVRTSGCHLRCQYCDTKYAYHDGTMMGLEEILKQVKSYPTQHVCVTGGEPLLQQNVYALMTELCNLGYAVSLETSGDIDCKNVDLRVKKIIDIKTPDSGEGARFNTANLDFMDVNTEFKFVICSEKDFSWAEDFAKSHNLFEKTNVFYSPSYSQVEERWLAEKILANKSPARLQLQLHKYIWSPDARGV